MFFLPSQKFLHFLDISQCSERAKPILRGKKQKKIFCVVFPAMCWPWLLMWGMLAIPGSRMQKNQWLEWSCENDSKSLSNWYLNQSDMNQVKIGSQLQSSWPNVSAPVCIKWSEVTLHMVERWTKMTKVFGSEVQRGAHLCALFPSTLGTCLMMASEMLAV